LKRDKLISMKTLEERLAGLEDEARQEQPYRPEFAAKLVERTLLEVRGIIREAAAEYISTSAAEELTGYEVQTLRKYARLMLDGRSLPAPWDLLVARRQGRDFEFLVSSLPSKPVGRSTAA
jgi:hypothetical protein